MKNWMIIGMIAMMMFCGYQHYEITEQQTTIQQLQASNEAYYEGLQVMRAEEARLSRVNDHYARVLSAK